ncbi:MAG: hypothetical protein E6J91_27475 [Deltaproteobacteria bacterium]|nr:MAG: hypothetical protein E6J91_27475 [Deltaproteobacteria bacterium]
MRSSPAHRSSGRRKRSRPSTGSAGRRSLRDRRRLPGPPGDDPRRATCGTACPSPSSYTRLPLHAAPARVAGRRDVRELRSARARVPGPRRRARHAHHRPCVHPVPQRDRREHALADGREAQGADPVRRGRPGRRRPDRPVPAALRRRRVPRRRDQDRERPAERRPAPVPEVRRAARRHLRDLPQRGRRRCPARAAPCRGPPVTRDPVRATIERQLDDAEQRVHEGATVRRRILLDAAYSYLESSPQFPIFPVDPVTKCGIATPTGAASGVVVIDVDHKHDGEELLAALERALGPLPRVRVVRTQSGGLHIYLAHPGGGIRVRTGAGANSPLGRLLDKRAGVDVRADGGIVVLPPSLGYRWIADEDERLPSPPPLWLAAIQGAGDPPPRPRRPTTRTDDDIVGDMLGRMSPIADGTRNGTLFRIGVRLRHDGRTESEILDALDRINVMLAAPPLSGREVQKIARSAAREAR